MYQGSTTGNALTRVFTLVILTLSLLPGSFSSTGSAFADAPSVDAEIRALRQRLARLEAKQAKIKSDALAAQQSLPAFIYRPGNGLTISSIDGDWQLQFGNRLTTYWTFWNKSRPKQGTTNGVLQVRRFRPYMNARLRDGFYDLRFKLDLVNGQEKGNGFFTAFDAEMYIHFEQINPWLPYFGFGASPAAILNPQDTNCSSRRCGRSERSFLNDATGIVTGAPDRAVGVVWNRLPRLGPVRVTYLNFWLGQDRLRPEQQFGSLSSSKISTDGRSLTAGIGIRPLDGLGNIIKNNFWRSFRTLELSFGTVVQKVPRADGGTEKTPGFQPWNVRTDQTRAQRISLIKTNPVGTTDMFYYFTPGLGWKWEWITLRLAGQFATARLCDPDSNNRCDSGDLVRASGWRFMGEFWLWRYIKDASFADQLFASDPRRGGLMIAPMFQRVDVRQTGTSTLYKCGDCTGAHAVNAGIGFWYFIPGRFMNVGLVWDHWLCANCNKDLIRVIPGFVGGGSASFDTVTLISRFQF